jgi:RNA polymerase sigma-70 factor, ECF subfamily
MTPVEAFAAAAAVEVTAELVVLVDAAIAACAAAHPEIAVVPGAFAEYLGTRSSGAPPTDEILFDLHLAFAAAKGSAPAIARFEIESLPSARAALRALRVDDSAIDEALQRVRDKLLVGSPPRVLEYRGAGRLRAWVRVVAIREHLMAQRGRSVEVSLDDAMLAAVPDPTDDPAIAALDVRDRSLLRYSLVDGLDLGAIASIFQTHKSTISRWLARARTRLWGLTRDSLIGPGGIDRADVESLVRAMRSGLDLSLARLLVET